MFKRNGIVSVATVCLGLNVLACSSERDVEVRGTVSAPSSLVVGDSVLVEFFDEDQDSVGVNAKGSLTLRELGDFEETVALEGERVLVRAIDDRDRNLKCTEGEAWGDATASIENDKAEAISVTLALEPCPYPDLDVLRD